MLKVNPRLNLSVLTGHVEGLLGFLPSSVFWGLSDEKRRNYSAVSSLPMLEVCVCVCVGGVGVLGERGLLQAKLSVEGFNTQTHKHARTHTHLH